MKKKRGLASEDAKRIRKRGHDDALEFALSIGLNNNYSNDIHAKKDVIDPSGDAHSVKSGQKKWQVFLYGLGRFESDDAFRAMNGIGDLLIACIHSFPLYYIEYQRDKSPAKEKLRKPMTQIAERLQSRVLLRAFMNKSLFNSGEVDYLTVKHNGLFHIFYYNDVVKVLGENLEVCNSKAIARGQTPEQKVLFRYKGKNLAELEMRNDSPRHYRQIRFNMIKPKVMDLLFTKIPFSRNFNNLVLMYGNTVKHFGRWK